MNDELSVTWRDYVDSQDNNLRREMEAETTALRREFTNELRNVRHELSGAVVTLTGIAQKIDGLATATDQSRGAYRAKDRLMVIGATLLGGSVGALVLHALHIT